MSLPVPSEQTHLSHPKYRTDIDGLRAIAILSVVGFHAFPNWITGGFVGVDIFFVISGFLISSIIISSLQKGTFSFKEFYARRVKRIFPALILVMTVCYAFGWFALLPGEYGQLGKHIAAGAGFVSNLIFWQEAGYFDNAAQTKPLLHLWSLGIEEQFYIIWPLLLYSAWKRRFNFLVLAFVIVALSFTASVILRWSDPDQDFYSPLTRFWELLMGSILAHLALKETGLWYKVTEMTTSCKTYVAAKLGIDSLCNAQSILGALLLGIAVILVTNKMAFPGWLALLPTAGTYLIISAGPHAWLNRKVLSHRVMVWFGLISYPLYLWHWPLLSFARIMEGTKPSINIRLPAIVLALVLAWLTYRLVENPLRFGKQNRAKIIGLVLLMIIMACVGDLTYVDNGLRFRMPQNTLEISDELNLSPFAKWSACSNESDNSCHILDPSRKPDIAVIGDSHAGVLASGFAKLGGDHQENIVIRSTINGCSPFFEISDDCGFAKIINRALEDAISSTSIKKIILSGYAQVHINGLIADRNDNINGNLSFEDAKTNVVKFESSMRSTLQRLMSSGKEVFYIVDVPELDFRPSECFFFRPVVLPGYKAKTPCAIDRQAFNERNAGYHRIIAKERAEFPTVRFINAYSYLCDSKLCYGAIDGKLLYTDFHHLSPEGSRYLVRNMANDFLH